MQGTYEFELFEQEGWFVASSFDLGISTQGESFSECCEMVADLLRGYLEDAEMHQRALPPATFGNETRHGGRVVVFSVVAGKETIEKVSKAEAARMLHVTPGRVTQLVSEHHLETLRVDGREWVTRSSVYARLAEAPGLGRPKAGRATSGGGMGPLRSEDADGNGEEAVQPGVLMA